MAAFIAVSVVMIAAAQVHGADTTVIWPARLVMIS